MRVRFSIDPAAWARACEYAELTHRSPSELVVEALEQLQARYPKRRHASETDIDALVDEVCKRIALRYPQVHPEGNAT